MYIYEESFKAITYKKAASNKFLFHILADEMGEAIQTYCDYRNSSFSDFFSERLFEREKFLNPLFYRAIQYGILCRIFVNDMADMLGLLQEAGIELDCPDINLCELALEREDKPNLKSYFVSGSLDHLVENNIAGDSKEVIDDI